MKGRSIYFYHSRYACLPFQVKLYPEADDTTNCDEVAAYLENSYPDLKDTVLVIHTKNNGEISESASGKSKEELDKLRKQANEIDNPSSPYKAVVSVMVLKEGWDVRNVTTIVGLRPYKAKSNILPEQTLGRGLRKMYFGEVTEYLSVVGTPAFMEFVESIQAEGVILDMRPMGPGTAPQAPLVIEVDKDNLNKNIEALDIEIPVLTPRIYREYKNLMDIDEKSFAVIKIPYMQFSEEQQREIVFRDITNGEITHTTILDSTCMPDYHAAIGYFTQTIMKELRLVSGYEILYGKIKSFIQEQLFNQKIALDNLNTLRNLSELRATKTIIETFKTAINKLTIHDIGDSEIRDSIKISQTRPFVVKEKSYLIPNKSVFNKVIGDSHFELMFAGFLEKCSDVKAYAKNYFGVHFKIDYVNADGNISDYYPDFLVKLSNKNIYIVETKGQEDLDVPLKMNRLRQWCQDLNQIQSDTSYNFVFVDVVNFEKYHPDSFEKLVDCFKEYKE
ncbi:hypothetical protein VLL09_05865 [Dehalococcoides mccartyi]|uniref:Type III restriction enzyme C-terminal endonuclease domain-containing protein n=1 Tax=Dehalococcoides mccartyi TaxID=61435 RepID=A0AB38Z8G5_9CHLR|nr:hypothetical protein [Dehalococcoides mccartyi]WRO06913.1 hypothetical protein VLL09_05865 [Dehalococcoides mccartyi]